MACRPSEKATFIERKHYTLYQVTGLHLLRVYLFLHSFTWLVSYIYFLVLAPVKIKKKIKYTYSYSHIFPSHSVSLKIPHSYRLPSSLTSVLLLMRAIDSQGRYFSRHSRVSPASQSPTKEPEKF